MTLVPRTSFPRRTTGQRGASLVQELLTKKCAVKGAGLQRVQVSGSGDIAVASFRLELDQDWGGQKLLESSRYTEVFARRGGRWLLLAHQETAIPNTRRLAIKVDPSVFDAYAGEYQLTPNYIVKVKREGDKLMDHWPGDAGYIEDVPLSETTFWRKVNPER